MQRRQQNQSNDPSNLVLCLVTLSKNTTMGIGVGKL